MLKVPFSIFPLSSHSNDPSFLKLGCNLQRYIAFYGPSGYKYFFLLFRLLSFLYPSIINWSKLPLECGSSNGERFGRRFANMLFQIFQPTYVELSSRGSSLHWLCTISQLLLPAWMWLCPQVAFPEKHACLTMNTMSVLVLECAVL